MPTIEWQDFEKIDIRAGTILEVSDFPKAKKPAWRNWFLDGRLTNPGLP